MSRSSLYLLLTHQLCWRVWCVECHWSYAGRFCSLEWRVWWSNAVAVSCFYDPWGVAICRNLMMKYLSYEDLLYPEKCWLFSKCGVWCLEGSWKVDEVVLQAVCTVDMWMGFSTLMNVVAFPGQIRVIVFASAESAVVRIQIFGAIYNGMLTSEVFLTCSEHHADMLARFLLYKAEVHVGGFANGWNGVGM